ncbi:uncharacterized protein (DUF1015 family) [Enterococcus sp. PF1-24]|uniref:DUF1015 domain-containing protein n=1 Tax=unclassified Enterococcus TaxID=2608891 RepID=UPI002476E2F0|nr:MULTISPECIES: DUF1015 family protein [unclassified Enterococcus]MDH6364853.1 uncharacterized protein (DUF1015 family) [Enterococcus sp. PFB1-1]MDH6401923.1 uncharacterized protein (DUF1015 family) [Enterococcus sp. PF1-24]
MVVIQPFKGIRPQAALAQQVATLPYDVLNSQEAYELAKENPYSYLHIDKAEINLPKELSPYDPQVYQKAAAELAEFLQKDWLIKDSAPCLYLYQLTMAGRSQTGLVTCTAIHDYQTGKIKKHEYTRLEKELDRINHSDACNANTSPIFLTYRRENQVQTIMDQWQAKHQPVYDFDSFHEVHHRVWVIDETAVIEELVQLFAENVPALYIADGHHRTESAVKVGLKRQAAQPDAPADAEFNFFLSVIFPKEELAIWDYNRVVNVPLTADFLTEISEIFEIEKFADGKPTQAKQFGMYFKQQWYHLTIKENLIPSDPVEKLDVALLQRYIFNEKFGITDIRTDKRIDFVGGIRGMAELEKLVDSGAWQVAFALYPTTMDDLLAVADADKIMPPKSTWFEPKLLSGLFLHDLA